MNELRLESINRDALELFAKTKIAFSTSSYGKLREKAQLVPNSFVDKNKKIRIVFAGQYSAGKSAILSILTGIKLEVGQGVTTNTCNFLDWNGIEVVDTPGIHTQKRPDHDEITYKAMSEADLIVFVCTAEGFSEGLGTHFRKLLIEKGKGEEMMLVFNKMEDSKYGNTHKGQKIFFENDVLPVISPEYTREDLFVSFVDTYSYQDAQETEGNEKDELMKMSGYNEFIENMNRFVEKKKILGKCTTSLYILEQMLSETLSEFKTGDTCIDGSIEMLNQQRHLLLEAEEHIKTESYDLIRQNTQKVRNWGDQIANTLTSKDKEDEVNKQLKDKYDETNSIYSNAAKELAEVIQSENDKLVNYAKELETSEFGTTLKNAIEEEFGKIKMSDKTAGKWRSGAQYASEFGQWLSKFARGKDAESGWSAIFKLKTYSGSDAHHTILQVGHYFGKKFDPWEAVKKASKIGKFGKVLGVGGALLGVGLQIWDDRQQKNTEKQMIDYRSDVRNTFTKAANVIDLQFDKETQTWVEKNISPSIKSIDDKISEIQSSINCKEKEFETFHNLLGKTRELISTVQNEL